MARPDNTVKRRATLVHQTCSLLKTLDHFQNIRGFEEVIKTINIQRILRNLLKETKAKPSIP